MQYFVLYLMLVASPLSGYKGLLNVLTQINTGSPTCGRQGSPFYDFFKVGLPITISGVKGKVFMGSQSSPSASPNPFHGVVAKNKSNKQIFNFYNLLPKFSSWRKTRGRNGQRLSYKANVESGESYVVVVDRRHRFAKVFFHVASHAVFIAPQSVWQGYNDTWTV